MTWATLIGLRGVGEFSAVYFGNAVFFFSFLFFSSSSSSSYYFFLCNVLSFFVSFCRNAICTEYTRK